MATALPPIPQELNELDWKEDLSPDNAKLCRHLSAFANQPGGGFMVFGIEDKPLRLVGVTQQTAENVVQRLGSLGRDSMNPVVTIDHAIETYQDVPLLFIHVRESAIKPVHLKSGTMEDAYIRSGGTTRKASRQEIGGLMLNSKTPHFEELHASKLKAAPEVLDVLDYRSIYKLLGKPVPQSNDEVLQMRYWRRLSVGTISAKSAAPGLKKLWPPSNCMACRL